MDGEALGLDEGHVSFLQEDDLGRVREQGQEVGGQPAPVPSSRENERRPVAGADHASTALSRDQRSAGVGALDPAQGGAQGAYGIPVRGC